MFKIFSTLLITALLSFGANATTFIPTSLEKLLEQSSAIAEVLLASKQVIQNEMGIIQTVHTFEVLESVGLEEEMAQSKLIGVTMIGGTLNGLTSYIDGAPDFEIGEKSFLLLKRIEGRLYLSNFSMGKYLIKEQDGQRFYESTVFPKDGEIGLVKKQKMIQMFREIKSASTGAVVQDKIRPMIPANSSVISFTEQQTYRDPATQENASVPSSLISFFIFGWLLIMGYVFIPKRSGK